MKTKQNKKKVSKTLCKGAVPHSLSIFLFSLQPMLAPQGEHLKFIEILISCCVAVIDLLLWKQHGAGVFLLLFLSLPEVSELQQLPTVPPIKEKNPLSAK